MSSNVLPLALLLALAACNASTEPGADAADLTAATEIGVISDLDDTLIPKADPELSIAPVPGIAKLYDILEHRQSGRDGDVYYVTARVPDRVKDVRGPEQDRSARRHDVGARRGPRDHERRDRRALRVISVRSRLE